MIRSLFRRLMSFRPGRYVAGFDRSSKPDYTVEATFEVSADGVKFVSVKRIEYSPGDVFLFKSRQRLPGAALESLSRAFERTFPNCRALLLDDVDLQLIYTPRQARADFYVNSAGECFPENVGHR